MKFYRESLRMSPSSDEGDSKEARRKRREARRLKLIEEWKEADPKRYDVCKKKLKIREKRRYWMEVETWYEQHPAHRGDEQWLDLCVAARCDACYARHAEFLLKTEQNKTFLEKAATAGPESVTLVVIGLLLLLLIVALASR